MDVAQIGLATAKYWILWRQQPSYLIGYWSSKEQQPITNINWFRLQMVTNRGNTSCAHWSNLFWFSGGIEAWLFSSNCASVVWGWMHQCSVMDCKREKVLRLIECYRKHPCLWNSTLKYYKCKDYRDIVIKEMFAANYPHLQDHIKKYSSYLVA